jgi:hypothetical protein
LSWEWWIEAGQTCLPLPGTAAHPATAVKRMQWLSCLICA